MKRTFMKKAGAFVLACALMVTAIPAFASEAAAPDLTGESVIVKAQASTFDITQTAATGNSVTISWPEQEGTVMQKISYTVYVNGTTTADFTYAEIPADATSYTITGLQANARVSACIYCYTDEEDSNTGYDSYGYDYYIKTKPSKVSGLSYYAAFNSDNYSKYRLSVSFTASDATNRVADGYEAVLYNKNGKKLETVTVSDSSSKVKFSKAKLNNIYKVRIRSYVLMANTDTKVYSDWSSYFYAVPNPQVTLKAAANNTFKVTWKKVAGAAKYEVYVAASNKEVSASDSLSYKKVATVSSKKKSYTVKKVKGKKVNTKKKYYYVVVVAKGRFGSKVVSSKKTQYVYCHTY